MSIVNIYFVEIEKKNTFPTIRAIEKSVLLFALFSVFTVVLLMEHKANEKKKNNYGDIVVINHYFNNNM